VGREYIKVCKFLMPYGISLRDSTIAVGGSKIDGLLLWLIRFGGKTAAQAHKSPPRGRYFKGLVSSSNPSFSLQTTPKLLLVRVVFLTVCKELEADLDLVFTRVVT
jgi:hypothetical protein